MVGYLQAPIDLTAILTLVEQEDMFKKMPILLYGHSLDGYTSAFELQEKHRIAAVVSASGFDTPKEQWEYCIRRISEMFDPLLSKCFL